MQTLLQKVKGCGL